MTATAAPLLVLESRADGTQPLPLLPVWRRFTSPTDTRMGILYTALQCTVPDGSRYMLTGGLNISTIYDFCGGCFVTSFNARAVPINARWMDAAATTRLTSVPSVEQYLGPDWYAAVAAAYESHAPVGGVYAQQIGIAGMLSRFVGASVFSRMMLTAGASNQNIVTFWDKWAGSTRAWLKYGAELFRERAIRAPRSYALQASKRGTWGAIEDSGGTASLYAGHHGPRVPAGINRLDEVTTVNVDSFSPGRRRINRNSGNAVSAGAVFLDSAPHFGTGGFALRFSQEATRDVLDKHFCGDHIHYVSGVTQNFWYSMG